MLVWCSSSDVSCSLFVAVFLVVFYCCVFFCCCQPSLCLSVSYFGFFLAILCYVSFVVYYHVVVLNIFAGFFGGLLFFVVFKFCCCVDFFWLCFVCLGLLWSCLSSCDVAYCGVRFAGMFTLICCSFVFYIFFSLCISR